MVRFGTARISSYERKPIPQDEPSSATKKCHNAGEARHAAIQTIALIDCSFFTRFGNSRSQLGNLEVWRLRIEINSYAEEAGGGLRWRLQDWNALRSEKSVSMIDRLLLRKMIDTSYGQILIIISALQ